MSEVYEDKKEENTTARKVLRHSFWFFIVISIIVHMSGFTPVIIEKLTPEEKVKKISPEELAKQVAEEEELARQELLEQKRATLEDQLQAAFESIATDVDEETVEEIWEEVEVEVEQQLADLDDMMQQEDYDMSEFTEDYNEMSAEMFEKTADILKDMLREEMKKATLAQVREQTLDKMAKDLDKRMEQNVGNTEEKRLSKAAQNDTKRRQNEAMKDLDAAKKALDKVANEQEKLAKSTEQKEKKELSQKDQEKLDKAQENLQKKREAAEEKLAEAVDQAKEFVEPKSDPKEKLEKAAEKQQEARDDLAKKEKAAEEMKEAAKEMKETSKELAHMKDEIRKQQIIDEEAKEALKKLIEEDVKEQVQEEFDETLTEELAPESAKSIIAQADKYLKEFGLDEDEQLKEELQKELEEAIKEEIPERMKDSADQLAMNKTEKKLKLEEVDESDRKLEEMSEERKKQLEQLAADVSKKAEANRKKEVDAHVKAAKRSAKLGDMSKRMQELKEKLGMMQKAELMAKSFKEGRGDLGEMGDMMAMMEMMEDGEGNGTMPPGASSPFGFRYPVGGRGRTNYEVYAKMLKMSQERNKPGVAYEDIERQAEQLVSRGDEFPEMRDALIVNPLKEKTDEEIAKEEAAAKKEKEGRKLADPDFNPLKYGFATMTRKEIKIDGKLDEWDLDRVQYCQNVDEGGKIVLPEERAVPLYIMWDHDGLYIAVKGVKWTNIDMPPNRGGMWNGSSIEVWVDTSEVRGSKMNYYEAIQMFFCPFGHAENKEEVAMFGRGWSMRGKPNSNAVYQRNETHGMRLGYQREADGTYTVELFAPQDGKVIMGPQFKAGKHIGFQISINKTDEGNNVAWAVRTGNSWDRPDLWGDILLLGSDAEISFFKDEACEQPLDLFVPGEPVWVQVHDPDMNLDKRYKDQIMVSAVGAGGYNEVLVLGETDVNTGKFVGGINTINAYAGLKEKHIPVEPGKQFKVIYIDQRRDYGESNKRLEEVLTAAWPTLRLSKN